MYENVSNCITEFIHEEPARIGNVASNASDAYDERKIRKLKLDALVEERKKKQGETIKGQLVADGERVGLKGKLASLVLKPRKTQHEKAPGKRLASKRKKGLEAEKVGKTKDVENANTRGKNVAAVVGDSDDDFVDNVGERRKKMDEPNTGSGKGATGNPTKVSKDNDKSDRIVARIPPASLFKAITSLTHMQRQDVIDMGFGDILEFKISKVPTRLAFWLLEMFDENTCSLNLPGRVIKITRELVRELLGVPMGEVHLDARDEANHRNELTRRWKAQFGTIKRHYSTHVAKLIVEKKRSGWLFKINFLVLFFSTFGEANLNNTVNLKFLHLLNNEDDIVKLDWCTYIIESLIKTKRSWKREGFYCGPIVLLLVLYAHSVKPIKVWSTEMLNKLEADVFPNDDGGDTCVGEEAEAEVRDEEGGMDEERDLGEDDIYEDYGIDDVPSDFEGLKKCIAACLKRAGKLCDRADQLIDEGLDIDNNDAALLELKELRSQLFAVPTYYEQPKEGTYPDEYANYSFHTPENGGEPYPVTQVYGSPTGYGELSDKVCEEWHRAREQIPTRLDFDDTEEIDLNVTQPPATQGKFVGDSNDGTAMEEGEDLLEGLRNYDSQDPADADMFTTPVDTGVCEQEKSTSSHVSTFGKEGIKNENKEIVPSYSEPKPLNVIVGNVILNRLKRKKFLPENLRSPYVVREVSLVSPRTMHEIRVAECFFSARFPETDIVFKTDYVDGTRGELETLYPGIDIACGAINMFTHVLNDAEKQRNKKTPTRLYCHTSMLTIEMCGMEFDKASERFSENMKTVLERSEYRSLVGVDMTDYVDGTRGELETLYPGIDIACGAINMFTHVLNDAEKQRNKKTPTRLYCHTSMLTIEMCGMEFDKASERFSENMKTVLERSEYRSLVGVDMVIFPIISGRHFFLVVMNMKDNEVQIFDNIYAATVDEVKERYGHFPNLLVHMFEDYMLHENNPNHGNMRESPRMMMETKCRTRNNFVDCGVFVMRHMETFKGDEYGDCCRLSEEGREQIKELCDLRRKYAVKILLADCNNARKQVEIETHGFRTVPDGEKKRLEAEAFKNIKRRAKQFLD
ncbi:ulp1 protease family, C-terminal catalytic domain-containing protein [Artemisia annua]|uniref:Ulp1 protease family, C-terminal catalytic domain-containing protein n=1 Tax=Artemisia annua TaxID=35608 RepID=A0A2U1M1U7_ARTAN|nr:ulp1 protease family, C-terminal catalytic domain-containing protein [Artemisia annua]